MRTFAITYKWVAAAVVSVKGDTPELATKKLLDVFPNVEILQIDEEFSPEQLN